MRTQVRRNLIRVGARKTHGAHNVKNSDMFNKTKLIRKCEFLNLREKRRLATCVCVRKCVCRHASRAGADV